MVLVDVGHLVRAHAVVAQDVEQVGQHEREREHARALHAGKPRDDDREDGEHGAPCCEPDRVPHEVALRVAGFVFLVLPRQVAVRHGAKQAVEPIVDELAHRVHALGRRVRVLLLR